MVMLHRYTQVIFCCGCVAQVPPGDNGVVVLHRYALALRQLRQQALVMTFPPTEPSRLASRLSEVGWHP